MNTKSDFSIWQNKVLSKKYLKTGSEFFIQKITSTPKSFFTRIRMQKRLVELCPLFKSVSGGFIRAHFKWIDGKSLAELKKDKILSSEEIFSIFDALRAKKMRFVHGDISPSNIIVNGDQLELIDPLWDLKSKRGTPSYAHPKCARGIHDIESDMHSIAKVMHYLTI